MIKPRALRPGDRIATISLSHGWPSVFPRAYEDGKRQLMESFGVEVVESRYARADKEWLAEHPEARAADLMETLLAPEIHGIVSTIGGDDSIRMIPYINFDVIRENPKVFLGYSDSTVTHFAFFKAGVVSYYGPSIMAGFDEPGGLLPYTEEFVGRVLFAPSPSLGIVPNQRGWTIDSWEWGNEHRNARTRSLRPCSGWRWLQGSGQHRGRLLGGCLEVMDWLRGTILWPEPARWRDVILFFETSEDQPSPAQVTCILRAMAATGALNAIRGVLFGRPYGDQHTFETYDDAILRVLAERDLASVPVVSRMDFGHTDPKFILPLGIEAEIDCDTQQIRLTEPPTLL